MADLVERNLECSSCGHKCTGRMQPEHIDAWAAARIAEHADGAMKVVDEFTPEEETERHDADGAAPR